MPKSEKLLSWCTYVVYFAKSANNFKSDEIFRRVFCNNGLESNELHICDLKIFLSLYSSFTKWTPFWNSRLRKSFSVVLLIWLSCYSGYTNWKIWNLMKNVRPEIKKLSEGFSFIFSYHSLNGWQFEIQTDIFWRVRCRSYCNMIKYSETNVKLKK